MREPLKMAVWGLPFGLALLAWVVYGARSLVLGISALDWRIYVASAVGVAAVTVAAGWIPARRATQVDPMEALRPGVEAGPRNGAAVFEPPPSA